MSERNRAAVEMRFSDGEIFNAWQELSLRDSFTDPLGLLEFTATPPRERLALYNEHLKKGELVAVLVNGAPQGNHLIQTVQKTISKRGGVTFRVTCQTVLATTFEASADPQYAFHSGSDVSITGVILDIMRPFGFVEVFANADDDVSARTGKPLGKPSTSVNVDALKHSDMQIQEGETAYAACARIVTRLGLQLRCDVGGRLLLERPNYEQDARYTVVQDFDGTHAGDRFFGDIAIRDTNEGQFSECVVRGTAPDRSGQKLTSRPGARVAVSGLTRPSGAPFSNITLTTLDTGRHRYASSDPIAPYKPKFVLDKISRDNARSLNTAKLIMGKAAKDAYVVTGEVDGFISSTGHVWSVNTIAHAFIQADDLDEDMWLLDRTLVQDRSGGQRTQLTLIPKGSLVLGDVPS